MLYLYVTLEEERSRLTEFLGVLGGIEGGGSPFGAEGFEFGMSLEIVGEAFCHDATLLYDMDARRGVLAHFVDEERVVGAAEYEGVNAAVLCKELVEVFLYEVVGSRVEVFVVLDDRDPHGASLLYEEDIGAHLGEFEFVGVRLYGGFGCHQSHGVGLGECFYGFDGRTDDSKDTTVGGKGREVVLLYATQGLGRGGVASEDNELAVEFEEGLYTLQGVAVDHLEGAGSIGHSGIVAEVDIVVLWETLLYAVPDGEATIARVEDADFHCWRGLVVIADGEYLFDKGVEVDNS